MTENSENRGKLLKRKSSMKGHISTRKKSLIEEGKKSLTASEILKNFWEFWKNFEKIFGKILENFWEILDNVLEILGNFSNFTKILNYFQIYAKIFEKLFGH